MRGWAIALLVACEHASPPSPTPPAPAPPAVPDARAGECSADTDCELQSRCHWSEAAYCVPYDRWMEKLCGDNDPPDPKRKLETCGCRANKCVVTAQ